MGRNILIIMMLTLAATLCAAETVKYFDWGGKEVITAERAKVIKHQVSNYDDAGCETSSRSYSLP